MDKSMKRRGRMVLALTPLLSYIIFESATQSILEIRGISLAFNLFFFYIFYLTLFLVTNSTRVTCIVLNTLLTVLALGEYYVVSFRYRPIMVWDALSLETALTVSSNYEYEITPHMAAVVLASAALSALAWKYPLRIEKNHQRAALSLGAGALFSWFLVGFYHGGIERYDLDVNMWDPVVSYREGGYILSSMVGLSYLEAEAPEGYSRQAVRAIAAKYEEKKADGDLRWKTESKVRPTHIICIMNESFSDMGAIGTLETDLPYLDYYKSMDKNCVKGNLLVPVFGAMTCNTEFEFLTGNSLKFAPEGCVPFQVYMTPPSYSLASKLKDQGYETIGMHPYPAGNWNRDNAYKAMGFDTFLAEEYYEGSELLRGYVSDLANYEAIMEVTESRKGEPLFIFNVTMQNHGGYEHEDFVASVHLTGYSGEAPMAEQYLTLMRESDLALRSLIEYYENAEDPTMIVLFGDHRPSVEMELYEELMGKPLEEISYEEYSVLYETPFLVWTNYETPYMEEEDLSAQYLATLILERANLDITGYDYMLDLMSRQTPVIHLLGYRDMNREWKLWERWEKKEEASLINEFRMMQHNNMFDIKNRVNEFFR